MAIISNDKHSIGDLFNNRNPFLIPRHQRAYSWEEGEVKAFCKDILEIDKEYFFGGIVSVHQHAPNGPGRTYRVVDGQQRLSTFTLLIAQLRNAFKIVALKANHSNEETIKETANSLAEELNNTYLTYIDTKQRPPKRENRLTMSKVDEQFFKDLLDDKKPAKTAESHKRLLFTWDTIFKLLFEPIINDASLTLNDQLNQLQVLLENILEQTVVIHIVCNDLDEAYQLFEVLNDRGKELAIGDYLRSTTLEILEGNTGYQECVSNHWDTILGKRNAEKFIKAYLTSYIATIKRSNVHRQFQKQFFSYESNENNEIVKDRVKNRVSNIEKMFYIYESLLEGVWPYENSRILSWEKQRLNMLIKQLEHKLCIPFLLAVYENATEEEFKEAIITTEKFVFRYITVSGLRANRLSQIYNNHILDIRENKKFDLNEYKKNLKDLIDKYCNEKFFAEQLEMFEYKPNSSVIKKVRYFLTTIEDYYHWYKNNRNSISIPQASRLVTLNIDNLDIEHIYPQSSTQPLEGMEKLKNSVGNLTFWSPSDNKSASNADFNIKTNFYSNSNIAITRELSNHGSWDENEIWNRKELYVDIARRVFNVYPLVNSSRL